VTLLSFAAIYLIWGSTFLAIRVAVSSIPPLLMMGVRCTTAGALLLGVAFARGQRVSWRAWRDAVVSGALMFGVTYGALAWAEQRIASGVAALLVATLPFWLVLFEWRQRGTRPSNRAVAGLLVGLTGVVVLVARGLAGVVAFTPIVAVLGGEIAWAAGSLYAKPRLPEPITLNAGMPLAAGGVLLLLMSCLTREFTRFQLRDITVASYAALAYLTLFGSIVAFSAYVWLMRVAPASQVGTHAYVNPLVALTLGGAVAGEPITSTIIAAGLVIAIGVGIVLNPEPRALEVL
jgi:drug/metabolite transporter (DMT)-like permease